MVQLAAAAAPAVAPAPGAMPVPRPVLAGTLAAGGGHETSALRALLILAATVAAAELAFEHLREFGRRVLA